MITKRLKRLADLIPPGKIVVDIGTDHAYLAVYLIKHNLAKKVIAVEKNDGPLKVAENNIMKYGLEERIELRKGDGIRNISSNEFDVAVIAGLGGLTINSILNDSIDVANNLQYIVLQPMSDVNIVRSYLQSHGFKFIDEELVYEDGRYYEIILVSNEKTNEYELDDMMLEIGPILFKKKHPLLKDYLEEKNYHYRKIIDNLNKSSKVGAQEKKKYIEAKVKFLEKVISCL
jgi:tRNA (adenine22-N1)-methyltransferase